MCEIYKNPKGALGKYSLDKVDVPNLVPLTWTPIFQLYGRWIGYQPVGGQVFMLDGRKILTCTNPLPPYVAPKIIIHCNLLKSCSHSIHKNILTSY